PVSGHPPAFEGPLVAQLHARVLGHAGSIPAPSDGLRRRRRRGARPRAPPTTCDLSGMPERRLLIITADDYGYSRGYDAGITEAAAANAVDSVSVMVTRGRL